MLKNLLLLSTFIISCNGSKFATSNTNNDDSNNADKAEGNKENDKSKNPNNNETTASAGYKPECFEKPLELPKTLTGLKEVFHWKPSGAKAAYNQFMLTPAVGIIKGDKPSIVSIGFTGGSYGGAGVVFAIDGVTGEQQWVATQLAIVSSPVIGDVDADGKNEVIIQGSDNKVHALNGDNGTVKWSSDATSVAYISNPLMIADINGDKKVDIIAKNKVLNGSDGNLIYEFSHEAIATLPIVDEEKTEKIISTHGVHNGKTGEIECNFSTPITYGAVGLMQKTDEAYTIVGIAADVGKLIAYNAKTCDAEFEISFPKAQGGPINLADVDGDNVLEIGIAAKSALSIFEHDGKIKWQVPTHEQSSGITGSTAFDLNGDGKTEIIYNDEKFLNIYEGVSGKVLYQVANTSATGLEYPVVVDIDMDGHAEIVVGANNFYQGGQFGIRVFKSPNNDWIGTRNSWNQHAYSAINFSNKGGILDISDSDWKKWVPSKHLLGFRNNIPFKPLIEKCK